MTELEQGGEFEEQFNAISETSVIRIEKFKDLKDYLVVLKTSPNIPTYIKESFENVNLSNMTKDHIGCIYRSIKERNIRLEFDIQYSFWKKLDDEEIINNLYNMYVKS